MFARDGRAHKQWPARLPGVVDRKKRLYVLAFAECGNRAEAAGIGAGTPYGPSWRSWPTVWCR
jgi:hypothetical protein